MNNLFQKLKKRTRIDWQIGTVKAIRQETPTVKTFTLTLPNFAPHRAGQHYDVRLTAEDGYQAHLQGVADEAGGMKRFATAEEIANFFVFLCSDKATYSTGSTYFVDGGWLKTV